MAILLAACNMQGFPSGLCACCKLDSAACTLIEPQPYHNDTVSHVASPTEHSDPEHLKEKAEEVRKEEVVKDFVERKKRVKEVSGRA